MGLLDELDEIDRQKSLAAKTNEVGLAAELDEIDALDTQYHLNKGLRTAFPVLSGEYGDSLAAQQQMQSELGSLQKAQQFYPDFQQRKKQAEIDMMQGSGMKNAAVAALNVVPEAMRILGQGTQLVTGGEFGQGLENLATGVSQDIYRDYATPKLLEQQKLLATAPDKLGAILSNPGATATIAAPSLVASMAPSTMLGSVAGKTALRYGLGAQRAGDIAGDVANLSNVFMNASQGFAEKNAEGMNPLQNLIGATAGAIVNRAIGSKTGGGAEGALARAMTGGGTGAVGKALLAGPVKGALDELGDNLSIEASKAVSENRTPEIGKTVEDSLIDMFAGALLGGAGDVSSAMQTNKQAKEIKADPVAKAIWDLEQEEKAKQQQAPKVEAKPEVAPQQPEPQTAANPVLNALNAIQEKIEAEKPQDQVEAQPVAQTQQEEGQVVATEPQAEVRRIDRKILQNRDRDDKESVRQMRTIANNPDYGRVGYSRDFANGAPVVAYGSIPEEQKGRTDYAVAHTGERIPVQYAVVDADTVSTSNDINGAENPDYGLTDRVMAVAGNGRVTALGQAYRQGSAQNYRQELTEDSMHGVNPEVIAKMKNPILVRIMPNERVRDDIGDLSNVSSNKSLSAIEQANNDGRRVDLKSLTFNEDGSISKESLAQFVASMPPTERSALMDKHGNPSPQAIARLSNAVFTAAYGNNEFASMYIETSDPEAKLVLSALARVAHKMIKLEGTGELDFRNALVDAVNAIIQGKRKDLKMQDILAQQDFLADPDVALFIELFARNPRSNKDAISILSDAADFAYSEAMKTDEDMFGEVQKAERSDIMNYVRDEFNKVKEVKNGKQAKQQANVQDASGGIGASQNVVGRDAGANQGTNERAGLADAQADEGFSLSGQTEQEIIADEKAEEERQAQAKREAEADEKQQAKEDFNKEVDSLNEDYANNFSLEDDTVSAEDALRGQKPLFSIAGEQGAKNRDQYTAMSGGRDSSPYLLRALGTAKQMKDAGEDALAIRLATGWEVGADGKWRYELPDGELKVESLNEGETVGLYKIYSAPELSKAYPGIGGIKVRYGHSESDLGGWYDASKNEIFVNSKYNPTGDDLKRIIVHEVQHYIQQIEGFARGGTPNEFKDFNKVARPLYDNIELYKKDVGFYEYLDKRLKETQQGLKSADTIVEDLERFIDESAYAKEIRAAEKELNDFRKEWNRKYHTAYTKEQIYRHLAGEVEARNAADRMNMSAEERRQTLLEKTEDTPRDEQIIKFSRKGEIKDPLVTLHNITENGLMKAARLGGLPAPSLAVSKVESPLQQFGEITLVGTKGLADPTKNPVFSVDAYTKRFPKLDWSKSLKKDESRNLRYEIEKAQEQVGDMAANNRVTYYLYNRPNRDMAIEKLTDSAAGIAMFFNHKGISFKPVRKKAKREWGVNDNTIAAYKAIEKKFGSVEVSEQNESRKIFAKAMFDWAKSQLDSGGSAIGYVNKILNGIVTAYESDPYLSNGSARKVDLEDFVESVRRYIEESKRLSNQFVIDEAATKERLEKKVARYQGEYEQYIQERVSEAFGNPGIVDGEKIVPLTLENVVRAMTRGEVRGAEGGFASNVSGAIRAKASKQYESMEDLQSDRERVVNRDESWESEKEVDSKIDEFISSVVKYWKYSTSSFGMEDLDGARNVLVKCAQNPTVANLKRALKYEGFEGVDGETIQKGIDALMSAKQVLTDYLEVKPQRAVSFSEFAGAVVPNTISDEARTVLEEAGLDIQTYNPKLEGGRVRATQRLINRLHRDRGDIKFSRNPRTGKMDIKLSIAWHGSPHVFEVFLTDHIGTGEGAQAHGWGLYFALNRDVAEGYRDRLVSESVQYFVDGEKVDLDTSTSISGAEASVLDALNRLNIYGKPTEEQLLEAIDVAESVNIDLMGEVDPDYLADFDFMRENISYIDFEVRLVSDTGRLFKVEIPDADVMLDEQKALKDQPKFIQDAVKKAIDDLEANGLINDHVDEWFKNNWLENTGFDLYWNIASKYDKKFGDDFDSTKAASLLLNKHGIKGIRYDGRRDGPCAVVFDDAAVKVLEFYSKNKPQESTGITVDDVTTALEADKDIGEAFKTLNESGEVNVVQSIKGLPEDIQKLIGTESESKFSIKRSDSGDIQGLYDPRTGKAYLIADALTNETAKPVFLHELGVHASYGKNPLKLEGQMKLARNMVNNGYAQGDETAVRVKERLFDAGEIDSMDAPIPMGAAEECMSYLVEEAAGADKRSPFRKWFDSLVTAIKQWLRNHGINVNLNQWDFVEIAKGNVVAMAKQSGKEMGLSYSKKGGKKPKQPSKQPKQQDGRFLERDELGRFRLKAGRKLIEGLGYTVAAVDSLLPVAYKIGNAPQALRIQIRDMKAKIEKAGMDATEMAKLMKEMPEAERKLISDVVEQELETGVNPPDHVMQIATKITQIMDEQSKELVELGMLSQESYDRYRGKYLPRFYLRSDEKEQIGFFAKIFGGRARMRGVAGTHLKGRGIFKEVPAKAAHNFIKLGWEVRDPNYEYANGKVQPRQGRVEGVDDTGMVMIWRDYRKEEREEMGEIRDASYRFAVGYMETQRDLAIGRLFKAIASNPDWTSSTAREGFVYVPKNEVPDAGGVLKYGALAGKYVDEVVLSHISHIEDIPDGLMRAFRQGMAFWKEGKTAMNPVSHMNNTVGNFVAAHLAGVNMWDAKAYSKALHSMRTADASFKEAQDVGLFSGSFSQEEFVQSLPEELKHLAQQEETGFKKFSDTLMRVFTWGLRDKLRNAYEFEDAFFKMAIYQKARESGMDPKHAVDYAHKFVFVYDTLPEGARKLRNSLFPFFAWTYQAIPMLATAAVCYPWRFFAPAAILYALNKAFFLAAAGDDDDTWAERWKKASQLEDAERTLLPKYMQGNTLFMTPKFLRLGIDEATGLPQYLNLSHMVPGGNFLDFENQMGGVPLPEILTPNHPLLNAFMAYIGNQDMFSGFDMTKETDTTGEKVQKYAEYTWKQLTPAIAIGNYHWNRLMDGVAGATGVTMPIDRTGVNRHGEVTTLDVAIQNMMGLKVRTFDPDNEMNRQMRGHVYNQRMIQSEKRSAYRRARAGALPMDSYQEFAKTADEKVREVRGEMGKIRKARAVVKDLSGK